MFIKIESIDKLFFLQGLLVYEGESGSRSVVSESLQSHGLQPSRLLCQWNSPGKNIGVGGQSFFQGIFPTQGSNPGLSHCRRIFLHLSHQGSLYQCIICTNSQQRERKPEPWSQVCNAWFVCYFICLIGTWHLAGTQRLLKAYRQIPSWLHGKEFACRHRRCSFDPWVREVPWRRKRQSTPIFLPGEFQGQRSLVGYSS